jgi:hypothetical protein
MILIALIFTATAVAGFAVIWRNWLEHHAHIKKGIKIRLGYWSKILLCGSCFTYWIAFLFILFFKPFNTLFSIEGTAIFTNTTHFLISWMSLSWASVFLRFLYVSLQEKVHFQVHSRDTDAH